MTDDAGPLPGSVLAAARDYSHRGWAVIPVPFRSKNPHRPAWEQLRIHADELSNYFPGGPQNIGVLTGAPSGWMIDIDLDHLRCVARADEFLPPTNASFGRPGKPRSHRVYRVTQPIATKKFGSRSSGMLVELRSTGAQTVFPPSTHESGEAITWDQDDPQPAEIDPEELLESVRQLADAVKVELGEKAAPKKPKRETKRSTEATQPGESAGDTANPVPMPPLADRASLCLRSLRRITTEDHRDGSLRLFVCACRCVEYALDDTTTLQIIGTYSRERPFAKAWTDGEILQRLRDAEARVERGAAFSPDAEGLIPLGQRDPVSGKLVLNPRRTLPTAEAYVREFGLYPEGRSIHNHAGQVLVWQENAYREVEDEALKQRLLPWLHGSLRYVYDRGSESVVLADFEANPGSVKSALDSLRAYVHLPGTITPPCWLEPRTTDGSAHDLLPCRSGLFHLPTQKLIAPTPRFFSRNALDFDPDPQAPLPIQWLTFLHQLFDGDLQALELLQEWFGLSLMSDTRYQKMLLLVGPRRSGKGTIARVLSHLVGLANVCAPTTSALAGPFGLQPLLGKTLAIVSDARFHGENINTVVERLLCISGEDTLTVDRKHMTSVTLKLGTRFVFLSNELPQLSEASGALAGRFLVLQLTQSFFGREDLGLTERLLQELPSILNWAVEGWLRLRERGHFVPPASAQAAMEDIEDLSSPVRAFVKCCCQVGTGQRVGVTTLMEAWKRWCRQEGIPHEGTSQAFGRDLLAAVAGVRRRRGTGDIPFYCGIALRETAP